jgi:hypothetical protein
MAVDESSHGPGVLRGARRSSVSHEQHPGTTGDASAPDDIQKQDLAYRALRVALLLGGTQWLFVAALMAQFSRAPSWLVVAVVVAGVAWTVGFVRYFRG